MASKALHTAINFFRRIVGTPRIENLIIELRQEVLRGNAKKSTLPLEPLLLRDTTLNVRKIIAENFLCGDGIEIGAFTSPLHVPAGVNVKYVDKYDASNFQASYEIAGLTLEDFGVDIASIITPDIVDDGECLGKIGDLSQDFVIANHVLEHFEDPIKGFKNMLRVLRHGGFLYLSLPEMRHSFDKSRQPTSFEHLLRDYTEGPAWSRSMAYAEFAEIFVAHGMDKGLFQKFSGESLRKFTEKQALALEEADYSIHFHAWTMDGMQDMFLHIKRIFQISFETKLVIKNNDEVIFIFQKTVPQIN